MNSYQLILLIGAYSQKYYLKNTVERNLTETVRNFEQYFPKFMVLPHPSPRNNIWMKKNPWFVANLLPILSLKVAEIIK